MFRCSDFHAMFSHFDYVISESSRRVEAIEKLFAMILLELTRCALFHYGINIDMNAFFVLQVAILVPIQLFPGCAYSLLHRYSQIHVCFDAQILQCFVQSWQWPCLLMFRHPILFIICHHRHCLLDFNFSVHIFLLAHMQAASLLRLLNLTLMFN